MSEKKRSPRHTGNVERGHNQKQRIFFIPSKTELVKTISCLCAMSTSHRIDKATIALNLAAGGASW